MSVMLCLKQKESHLTGLSVFYVFVVFILLSDGQQSSLKLESLVSNIVTSRQTRQCSEAPSRETEQKNKNHLPSMQREDPQQ